MTFDTIRNKDKILAEASVVLPTTTPDGTLREDIHEDFSNALLKDFEGCQITASEMFYKDGTKDELVHDDTLIYTVAIANTSLELNKFRSLAVEFAKKLEQNFVYLKQPNGEVYYLTV